MSYVSQVGNGVKTLIEAYDATLSVAYRNLPLPIAGALTSIEAVISPATATLSKGDRGTEIWQITVFVAVRKLCQEPEDADTIVAKAEGILHYLSRKTLTLSGSYNNIWQGGEVVNYLEQDLLASHGVAVSVMSVTYNVYVPKS